MSRQEPVAIITGAARGIGRAIAVRLATAGYSVILSDIRSMTETQHVIRERGGDAIAIEGDLTEAETIERVVRADPSHGERLEVLVNNAFHEVRKGFLELEPADWWMTWNASFLSMVTLSRAVLPKMLSTHYGRIINVSSVHAMESASGFSPYEAAKSAVNALTRSLAVEFGPEGIGVNAVLPGLVITERNRDYWMSHPDAMRAIEYAYPLRRAGTPDEVAAVVTFLASRDASFVTGAAIPVDGGLLAGLSEGTALRIAQANHVQSDE